jgi:hypothetical protein
MPHQELTIPERQALLHSAVDARRVDLPADIWLHLFRILEVPEPRWEQDARQLSNIMTIAAIVFEGGVEHGTDRKELVEVGVDAAALAKRMLQLGDGARASFEYDALAVELGQARDPAERERRAEVLVPAAVFESMVGRFSRFEHAVQAVADVAFVATQGGLALPKEGKGRRRKSFIEAPQEVAFDLFATLLFQVADLRGWRLTLSHNTTSGTVLDVLSILRPHVPRGLIPEGISMWRLRSAHARAGNTPLLG